MSGSSLQRQALEEAYHAARDDVDFDRYRIFDDRPLSSFRPRGLQSTVIRQVLDEVFEGVQSVFGTDSAAATATATWGGPMEQDVDDIRVNIRKSCQAADETQSGDPVPGSEADQESGDDQDDQYRTESERG